MKKNQPITLYNNGDDLRDYMHVLTFVILKIVMDKGETDSIYNIASGVAVSFRHIIEVCKKILGSESELVSTETPRFNQLVQVKNFALNAENFVTWDLNLR